MKFFRELYVGEKIHKKEKSIKMKLRFHKLVSNAYVIVLCDGTDELEYYHAAFLLQPIYKKKKLFLVGIAADSDEAVQMIQKILEDSMKTKYQYRLKEYIKAKQEKII